MSKTNIEIALITKKDGFKMLNDKELDAVLAAQAAREAASS